MKHEVRIGVIGLGNMGARHAEYLREGGVNRARLTAVCDVSEARLLPYGDVTTYTDESELIESGEVDAVIIATPHYFHTTTGIKALRHGLHVLVEKPISVHKADCERLLAANKDGKLVFAAMFQVRTSPLWRKVKRLIDQGELGEIVRVNWIVTDWFRTDVYFASSQWRATWKGEGGGVLLNQLPHQLDMFQLLFGMPERIRAFCQFGSRHNIEVEDQVTAYMDFGGGKTAVLVASTCEAPGTNRLEIAAERGKVVVENGKIAFTRNETPMTEFSRTTNQTFGEPDVWHVEIPAVSSEHHEEITQNFVDAILDGTELIAPATEGIKSVELANAMVYSSLEDRTIELPLDGAAYEAKLQELIANSRFQKSEAKQVVNDFSKSFQKSQ